MACPVCGSSEHVIVAPGVAECQGPVRLPPAASPGGPYGPEQFGVCRTRYQVPAPETGLGLCWCGLQAVGACTKCGSPACLDHLRRVDGRMLCVEDYEAHAQAQRTEAGQGVRSAWEAFSDALEDVRRTGVRGTPDRTATHFLTLRADTGIGLLLAAPDASALLPGEAAGLGVGAPCPRHPGGVCHVQRLTTEGRFAKRVTGAVCGMPLWDLCVIHTGRQGATRVCSDGGGGLTVVEDWEGQPLRLPDITPGFFEDNAARIRSATERLRALAR